MAFTYRKDAVCSSCSHRDSLELYGSINVRENPDLKEKVKDGSLFVWQCPMCGTLNLVKYETIYHDPEEKLMVWLLPEGERTDAIKMLSDQLSSLAPSLVGYTLRRVADVGSLIEKVNIHDAGLEDTIMELCKYITKMELAEKQRSKEESIFNAAFRFHKIEGADHSLVFSFPLDGNMHSISVGFNVYEDCRGIFMRNPAIQPDEGFAVVDPAWLARYIR